MMRVKSIETYFADKNTFSRQQDVEVWGVRWIEGGISEAEVARNLNVSRMMISSLGKQFQTTGTVVKRPGQGRPKVTTLTED
ncbi:hypothetical protein TNCV_4000851 [Trichonephila clavipes]|nr:hypothetical protein TNCV_4000851 [Trichonephila clavipes]